MVHDLILAGILIEAAWETAVEGILLHFVKFNIINARSINRIYTQIISQKSSKIRYLLISTDITDFTEITDSSVLQYFL